MCILIIIPMYDNKFYGDSLMSKYRIAPLLMYPYETPHSNTFIRDGNLLLIMRFSYIYKC